MDAATGLLYVGNGQYYDPATGRFLTRDAKPNNPNPYVPWNPLGAIFAPLAVLSMFYSRKRKRSKWDTMFIIALLGISAGVSIVACAPAPTPPAGSANTAPPVVLSTQTPIPTGAGTSSSNIPSTATPPIIILTLPDCPTATFTIPTPIGTPTPTALDPILESYGVRFIGDMTSWTISRVTTVREAVIAVAARMVQVAGGGRSSIDVFRLVYKGVNFSWGTTGASGTCLIIEDGGCTSGAHDINFVDLSEDDPLRARNNVVHELGHAFSKNWNETAPTGAELEYFRQHPEETNPAIVLAWAQSYQGLPEHYVPGFPDRQNPTDGRPGGFYGFASQQNVLTWQIAVTNAGDSGEEFADQFLGWTFDIWQRRADGSLTSDATLRRNFMDRYMPGWITYRINH